MNKKPSLDNHQTKNSKVNIELKKSPSYEHPNIENDNKPSIK